MPHCGAATAAPVPARPLPRPFDPSPSSKNSFIFPEKTAHKRSGGVGGPRGAREVWTQRGLPARCGTGVPPVTVTAGTAVAHCGAASAAPATNRTAFSPREKVADGGGRTRGPFCPPRPFDPSAPSQNRFTFPEKTADRRYGGVSGGPRGGRARETGSGTRDTGCRLVTRRLSLAIGHQQLLFGLRTPDVALSHLSLYFPCPGFAPVSRAPSPVPRFFRHLSLVTRQGVGDPRGGRGGGCRAGFPPAVARASRP